MGELRAYAVDLGRLRALLAGGPDARAEAVALVRPRLAPAPSPPPYPVPLGPIFTRVPGARVVRDDDPEPVDLNRLLGGEPVPAERVRATWRLVESLVAGLSVATASTPSARPPGLRPSPVALPALGDAVVGTWAPSRAQDVPALRPVAGAARSTPALAVLVFWSARGGRGPAG